MARRFQNSSQPLSPSMASSKIVFVSSVDRGSYLEKKNRVSVIDVASGATLIVPLSRSSRFFPREGEVWLIERSEGGWRFNSMVGDRRNPVVSNWLQTGDFLEESGLLTHSIFAGNSSFNHPQSKSGGYIGEIRTISYTVSLPPDGWLLCNGATYYKWWYPVLYSVINNYYGVSTDATFSVPSFGSSTVKYIICAY